MKQKTAVADAPPTRQFRMIYKFKEHQCEMAFTNSDDIADAPERELYKIFMVWAKLCTHQNVVNSTLKQKVVKALHGNEPAEKWLKARLAAYFVRHHCATDGSNALVIEDLQGEQLERYAQTFGDNSETWAVRKIGALAFLTPPRVKIA